MCDLTTPAWSEALRHILVAAAQRQRIARREARLAHLTRERRLLYGPPRLSPAARRSLGI
jgi:hypothetical protein